jgi:hypothetical protein
MCSRLMNGMWLFRTTCSCPCGGHTLPWSVCNPRVCYLCSIRGVWQTKTSGSHVVLRDQLLGPLLTPRPGLLTGSAMVVLPLLYRDLM